MILVKGLTKSYGDRRAITELNFSVSAGEVVGFLGPNGAGKSTTMKIITGFMAPTEGTARVAGFDVFENPVEVKKRIGYLPETPPVYLDMYVEDYLVYVAKLKAVDSAAIAKRVDYSLERTNLGPVRRRLIGNLSKGFRQRVGIAQALVSDPQVLILDEPTVGLDPKQVAEIRDLIRELRGQHTVILSTHVLSEVEAICSRVIIIHKGHIVAQDSLANLTAQRQGNLNIRLTTRRNAVGEKQSLLSIPGVLSVDVGAGESELLIRTEAREELIDQVAQHALGNKWGIAGLVSAKQSLEDVFLSLTYGSST